MNIAVVFETDPELGPDPLDEAKQPRRLGEFIADGSDVILIWRQWGEQFEGGSRTNIIGSGIWESITLDQVEDGLNGLSDL